MAFQQGLSGLNVYSKALDVVGNNIANVGTVGFKESQAHFGDIYAGVLYGATNKQTGIGVNLLAVQQQFSQGNISSTNNPLDIAINGNGFFRMQKSPEDQSVYYTRNGQFHVNKDGYIVNSNGTFLTGYASPDGVTVNPASIVPLTIGTGGIPPQQTGWTSSIYPDKGGLVVGLNLDGRDKKAVTLTASPSDPDWETLIPFNWSDSATPPFDPSMYNFSAPATIYDQSGTAHILTNYDARKGDQGPEGRTWDV
ncbi:MAG: flagellar hook-basal body complex protein, partial [Candidatus Accumulibacter sp.]|nr:flagellar hook-basal body complex protein [Accumulibacter sp.]